MKQSGICVQVLLLALELNGSSVDPTEVADQFGSNGGRLGNCVANVDHRGSPAKLFWNLDSLGCNWGYHSKFEGEKDYCI